MKRFITNLKFLIDRPLYACDMVKKVRNYSAKLIIDKLP